jgi:acyl-CoA thioesterase-1
MDTNPDRRTFLASMAIAAAVPSIVKAQGLTSFPDPIKSIQTLLSSKDPIVWLFTGDSITHGAYHTLGWRSYSEHFAERVRYELSRSQDVVINTGISGDTTIGLLKKSDWRIYQFQPRVVSLMMGMNDCLAGEQGREVYRQNLETIYEATLKHGGILLLHTPNPIYVHNDQTRADLPAYVEIIREVAKKHQIPLVDHYAHWFEVKKEPGQMLYWMSDGSIHPNQYGHIKLAQYLFQRLGIFDLTSPTSVICRLFVP